jgi:acyl-CoA synthetase (AMP-forming)/AMP-acid ligase II
MMGQQQQEMTSAATSRRTILALMAVAIMAAMVVSTSTPAEAGEGHLRIKACNKAQVALPFAPSSGGLVADHPAASRT